MFTVLEKHAHFSDKQRKLASKYFSLWKIFVQSKRKSRIIKHTHNNIDVKLSNFIKNLNKNVLRKTDKKGEPSKTNEKLRNKSQKPELPEKEILFENSYLAKEIEKQKTVISEQIKLIEELKIKRDIKLANELIIAEIENSKTISLRPYTKAIPKPEDHPLVQKMKEREEQRRQHRAFFEMKKKEKERYLEEKLIEEKEQKKKMELEQRKIKLREKKEQERLKKEEELARAKEKEFCKDLETVVIRVKDKLLCSKILGIWQCHTENMFLMENKCILEIQRNMLVVCFRRWKSRALLSRISLENIAQELEQKRIFKSCLRIWEKNAKETLRIKEAVIEWRSQELRKKVFRNWAITTKNSVSNRKKLTDTLNSLYERVLLYKAFQLWKRLPLVMYKERETEKRLREWESKVKSILPDYSSDNTFSF